MPKSKLRKWVKDMVELHPAPDGKPIRVIRRRFKDLSWAETIKGEKFWTIQILPGLSDQLAWMVFLHELAHIHAWDDAQPVDHNDCGVPGCKHWGCAYARLWRDWAHDGDHSL